MKKNLKRAYYADKLEVHKDDSKKVWELLREVTGNTKPNDNTEPDHLTKEKANEFNTYYASIGAATLNRLGIHVDEYKPCSTQGFKFSNTTSEEVENLINNMRTNTAVGYDQIPTRIIKDLAPILSVTLCELINLSFAKSVFPRALKHAIVRPIYKNKGTEDDPQYYRPISVLTGISKIFERAACNQIVKHLEAEKKLYKSQHAYRRHHSKSCRAD